MNSDCTIDFTNKESKTLMNEFLSEKVEKIRIFKTFEILCVNINIKSNSIKKIFKDIHFSPLTSFSFYIDSITYIAYFSICNQDICALIEIDQEGFDSENFKYILEKMKDTLIISSMKQINFLSFYANIDEYFLLKSSTVTFLKECVKILKSYIIKEYNLQKYYPTMSYSSFLSKSIKSILFFFLYRQSFSPSLFNNDKSFFENPLNHQIQEYGSKDFLFLEILKYDPSYFIQYAFHKETQSLSIAYVFRVDPTENFWQFSFKYPYIYQPIGYVKPTDIYFLEHNDAAADFLEEEENENENDLSSGCLIYPFINMINVNDLNRSMLLNGTNKTKIIYTIFYALDYIYYNSENEINQSDIFLTKIFLDKNFNAIISNGIDFFDTFQTGHIESPLYLPLEFIECVEKKTELTDIYSAGVCIYLLLSSDFSIEKKNFFQLNEQLHLTGFPSLSNEFGHISFIQKLCCSKINENKRKKSFLLLHLLNFFHCRIEGTNEDEIKEYILNLEKQRNFIRNESYYKAIEDIQLKSKNKLDFEYSLQNGLLLLFGEGVEKNVKKALESIKYAAENGYQDADYILKFIQSNKNV